MRRRRVLGLLAAASLASALGGAASRAPVHRFETAALGTRVRIVLLGLADGEARSLARRLVAELLRLEGMFSLYRADSLLVRLRTRGRLDLPPPELLELLALCRHLHLASDGAFDPTVQPLYEALARLARTGALGDGARVREALDAAWGRVGFGRMRIGPEEIQLPAGAALTLNGIAQGYIADRLVARLVAEGLEAALVDAGEWRALGPSGAMPPFRIVLPGGGRAALRGRGLAVSAPAATRFDPAGRFHHILDPRTARPACGIRQAVVEAETAALADGLATALCVLPPARGLALARTFAARARILDVGGRVYTTGGSGAMVAAVRTSAATSGRAPRGPV